MISNIPPMFDIRGLFSSVRQFPYTLYASFINWLDSMRIVVNNNSSVRSFVSITFPAYAAAGTFVSTACALSVTSGEIPKELAIHFAQDNPPLYGTYNLVVVSITDIVMTSPTAGTCRVEGYATAGSGGLALSYEIQTIDRF